MEIMLSHSTWEYAKDGCANTLLTMFFCLFVSIHKNDSYHLTEVLFCARTCFQCFT